MDNRHSIVVGHITGAHGLKGEVKLRSFTEDPLAISRYGPLEVEGDGGSVTILKLRPVVAGLVATLAGVTDRSAAEALRGRKLYLARSRLPEAEPGTCYHADLIGLEVETSAGKLLGRVARIVNYGAGDLLDVEVAGETETLLIPLAGARVEMGAARIMVDLPEGFLDA